MGLKHLKQLREFLREHKGKNYTQAYLRDELRQNFNTIVENLNYLCNIEKSVTFFEEKKVYRWSGGK